MRNSPNDGLAVASGNSDDRNVEAFAVIDSQLLSALTVSGTKGSLHLSSRQTPEKVR